MKYHGVHLRWSQLSLRFHSGHSDRKQDGCEQPVHDTVHRIENLVMENLPAPYMHAQDQDRKSVV